MEYSNLVTKLKSRIDKYDVISFDIFDTLIKRECAEPSRLFDYMENILGPNYKSFRKIRIFAEEECRKLTEDEEISIDDIYDHLYEMTGWNTTYLKNIELKYELMFCKKNISFYPVFLKAIQENKYVILTSDMYLPESFIIKILNNVGLSGYKKIYISSEYKMTKNNGTLYRKIIEELINEKVIVSAKDILHIGDNRKSDYIVPKTQGIHSVLIPRSTPTAIFNKVRVPLNEQDELEYKDLVSFISNHEKQEYSFFEKIGYETLGPTLLGFIKWLENEVISRGISKIFFLSRDGQIMKQAWDKLNVEISSYYMYGSRRAVIVPTLWTCSNWHEMLSLMFIPRIVTINSIINKLGLNYLMLERTVAEFGFEPNKYYEYSEIVHTKKFEEMMEYITPQIIENSKREFHFAIKYLRSIAFDGKVALVDIGWHANMQKAISKLCDISNIDVEIYGFYLGINPSTGGINNRENRPVGSEIFAKGYLFERGKNEDLFFYEKDFSAILEMMFSANHGSVIRYNNKPRPVLEAFEYQGSREAEMTYEAIKEIQNSAKEYINDALKERQYVITNLPRVYFNNLVSLGSFPNIEIANRFGNLIFEDGHQSFLGKPNSFLFYVKNIKKLVIDYHDAHWKIGFLKRILYLTIPYAKLRMIKNKIF